MNDLITSMVENRVNNRTPKQKLYFKLRKLKVLAGKGLLVYAALPLFSFWASIPGMMLVGIKPTVWARTKMIDMKERWRLR
jgi:hypothetical protein